MLTQRSPKHPPDPVGGASAGLAARYPVSWLTCSCSQSLSPGCSLVGSQKLRQEAGRNYQSKTENPNLVRLVDLPEALLSSSVPMRASALSCSPSSPSSALLPTPPACFLPCLADLFNAILGRRPGPVSRATGGQGLAGAHWPSPRPLPHAVIGSCWPSRVGGMSLRRQIPRTGPEQRPGTIAALLSCQGALLRLPTFYRGKTGRWNCPASSELRFIHSQTRAERWSSLLLPFPSSLNFPPLAQISLFSPASLPLPSPTPPSPSPSFCPSSSSYSPPS